MIVISFLFIRLPLSLLPNLARRESNIARVTKERAGRQTLAYLLHCILVLKYCFVTIHAMQSIDTHNHEAEQPKEARKAVYAGRVEDLPEGSCKTIEVSGGRELALTTSSNFVLPKTSARTRERS